VGEHQLIDKRWAYEESIRIPFLLRYPELVSRGSRESERLILNIDLLDTEEGKRLREPLRRKLRALRSAAGWDPIRQQQGAPLE
jgi:hypothetical protein